MNECSPSRRREDEDIHLLKIRGRSRSTHPKELQRFVVVENRRQRILKIL